MTYDEFARYIADYEPRDEQEARDQQVMLEYMRHFDNLFTRENSFAHFTSSSFIVNKDRDKTLVCYHNIYDSWTWTGGHADGDMDLLHVSVKEAQEETGAVHVSPVTGDIYSLDILPVWGHRKRGQYVSSHQHLNLSYLLEADEADVLQMKPDENSGVKWIPVEDMLDVCLEKEMHFVYRKLMDRLKAYK